MEFCFCHRFYRVSKPNAISEYAFSGSLCRIREFETLDGPRYCMTIFSLSDYKHLHFPHDEYEILIRKLSVLLSTHEIAISADSPWQNSNDSRLTITQHPINGCFKIKFGFYNMLITPVTAIGLLKTAPFTNVNEDEKQLKCDPKLDICACKSCLVFKRLIDFEAAAKKTNCKLENIIFMGKKDGDDEKEER